MEKSKEKYEKIEDAINGFIEKLKKDNGYVLIDGKCNNEYNCNVYNEFSLQHELGIFLRGYLEGNWKIFFEKNMYEERKKEVEKEHYWVKKEADLIAIKYKDELYTTVDKRYAIELKFKKGKNARTPENMFEFLRDLRFMEQIKEYNKSDIKFDQSFVLIIVDAEKYYYNQNENGNERTKEMYDIFRKNKTEYIDKEEIDINIVCKDRFIHPTGKKSTIKINEDKKEDRDSFILKNDYKATWKKIKDKYRYLFIEAK